MTCAFQFSPPGSFRAKLGAELSVFGSTVRGDAGRDSDIDLLVTFQSDAAIGLIAFNRLRRELEEGLGRRVDLVPKDGLSGSTFRTLFRPSRSVIRHIGGRSRDGPDIF